jgi:hypothetical protein
LPLLTKLFARATTGACDRNKEYAQSRTALTASQFNQIEISYKLLKQNLLVLCYQSEQVFFIHDLTKYHEYPVIYTRVPTSK